MEVNPLLKDEVGSVYRIQAKKHPYRMRKRIKKYVKEYSTLNVYMHIDYNDLGKKELNESQKNILKDLGQITVKIV